MNEINNLTFFLSLSKDLFSVSLDKYLLLLEISTKSRRHLQRHSSRFTPARESLACAASIAASNDSNCPVSTLSTSTLPSSIR